MWSILNAVATAIGSKISVSSDPDEVPQCLGLVFLPALMSWLLLDAIAGSGCAYLLINPLMKIHEMEHTNEFKRIAKKQAMLSGISVKTTWLALIAMALTNMHMVFGSMDLLVSTFCVILMYSWNKWMYEILCCCCSSKTSVKSIENIKNLEVVVDQCKSQNNINQATKDDIKPVSSQLNTAVIH